jgi:hypothetical protein
MKTGAQQIETSANAAIRRSGVSAERRKPSEIEGSGFLPKAATLLLQKSQILKQISILSCLTMAVAGFGFSSLASEYEVDGQVSQMIARQNGTNLSATASFTVYVRDCGWLIQTIETNENGGVVSREIGSTNGTEIYECEPGRIGAMTAVIESNNIPIGWLDSAVVGHLWLMFASQCYWPGLNSDQLAPIYDWRASVGNHGQNRRVSAEWKLLNGPGSLPREVIYFGALNDTNGLYKATGSKPVGGTLIPTGFIFEQYNNAKLVKRVEVEVAAIRPGCSRASLIPLPDGPAVIVDERFDSGVPSRPPSYHNPVVGQWPTVEESRKLAGVALSNDLRVLDRAGLSPFPKKTDPEETNPPVLSLSIRCTNEVVKAGDEIDIEFKITNRGTNDYRYANRTYDRSGRMNEYQLVATNSSGEAVPDPRANDKGFRMGGGLFQYSILKPGESFTKVIPLNRWALVKEPGSYMVVGTYPSESYSTNYITVRSDPLTVTVLPRTAQEMDAYIADLTNQLETKLTGKVNPVANESRPPDPAMNGLVTKLMFTCSPKIVPSLLKSMCDYGSGGGFWEDEAITYYVPHSEETKQAILAAANAWGLGRNWSLTSLLREYDFTKEEMKPLIERALAPDNEPGWAPGADLARQFPDDEFTARLIAIAKTPRDNAQTAAIDALAYNRTDEGVKTLKELLSDPHQNIWTPLAFAIQNAYNYRRDTMGRPLRPDDFTAEDMKPLIEHLMSPDNQISGVDTGINLIGQFGGDEYTARLIAIATSPDNNGRYSAIYALALNRTDEGVKTLKTLLNDPDPKIQKMTEDALRNAYTSHGNSRGRPLKPEDFDPKYREPEPGKSNL